MWRPLLTALAARIWTPPDVEQDVANRIPTESGAVVYPACVWRR